MKKMILLIGFGLLLTGCGNKPTLDQSNGNNIAPQETCAKFYPPPQGQYSCKDAQDTRPPKPDETYKFPPQPKWPSYVYIALDYSMDVCNVYTEGTISEQQPMKILPGHAYLKAFNLSIKQNEPYTVYLICRGIYRFYGATVKISTEIRPVYVKKDGSEEIVALPHNMEMKAYILDSEKRGGYEPFPSVDNHIETWMEFPNQTLMKFVFTRTSF